MIGLGGGRRLRCRLVVLGMVSLCDVLDGTMGLIYNGISHMTDHLESVYEQKAQAKTNTLSIVTSQLHGELTQPSPGLLLIV